MEGTELVVDVVAPPAWGPATLAAGAEHIDVPLAPDTGDATVARVAATAPGQWTVRIPVTAFTGAVPAPGTEVVVPLVVRARFRPDLVMAMDGGGRPLPDYGPTCDQDRHGEEPEQHDFDRWERLDVYVVAPLTGHGLTEPRHAVSGRRRRPSTTSSERSYSTTLWPGATRRSGWRPPHAGAPAGGPAPRSPGGAGRGRRTARAPRRRRRRGSTSRPRRSTAAGVEVGGGPPTVTTRAGTSTSTT